MRKELNELRSRVDAFPAMPGNAVWVLKVLQNPEAGADDIEQVVGLDPGLTANILRFANSAYVGSRGEVGSLREAVVRLGVQRLSEMTVAASVNSIMEVSIDGYDIDPGELWRHSIAVAVGAEILAKGCALPLRGDAFTAGLLHDIGKLIFGEFVKPHWSKLVAMAQQLGSFDAAEREVLGIDHADLGGEILAHWGLPKSLVAPVRWHHQPVAAPDPGLQRLLDVVHIADGVALMLGFNDGCEGLDYDLSTAVAERVGLDDRALESFTAEMLEGVEEMLEIVIPG